jgi:hypothetical protein
MKYCEKCGTKINEEAIYCGSCGHKINKEPEVQLVEKEITIEKESVEINNDFQNLNDEKKENISGGVTGKKKLSQQELDEFKYGKDYIEYFEKCDKNNGKMVFSFNIFSLIFGIIWYCVQGMWKKGFVLLFLYFLIAGTLIAIFNESVGVLLGWLIGAFYLAFCAKYDYYLYVVKKKTWW